MQACPRVTRTAQSHCAWHLLLWPTDRQVRWGWEAEEAEQELGPSTSLKMWCQGSVLRARTWASGHITMVRAGMQSLRTHYNAYFPSLYGDLWFSGLSHPFLLSCFWPWYPQGEHHTLALPPGDGVQWEAAGCVQWEVLGCVLSYFTRKWLSLYRLSLCRWWEGTHLFAVAGTCDQQALTVATVHWLLVFMFLWI